MMAWASGGWRAISSSVISGVMSDIVRKINSLARPPSKQSPRGVADYRRVGHNGPVDGRPAVALENRHPIRRQIHVDEDVDAHATDSGTSRSSTRHAA